MLGRRSFLFGLVAAPAVIRTPGLLMPVSEIPPLQTTFSDMRLLEIMLKEGAVYYQGVRIIYDGGHWPP